MNTKLDIVKIRSDFPILSREIHGHPIAYLDNAASTQKPRQVIEAIDHLYRTSYANVHRGVYTISEEATAAFEASRQAAAEFLGAPKPEQIVFVRNATEGFNLLAHAWARKFLKSGDVVLLTEMEHHANLIPWQLLAKDKGVQLRFVPITADGRLDLSKLDALLTPEVKLFSFSHMSNVLGTINPAKEIAARAKERGIVTIVDGAQAAPHIPVNVQSVDCDFYVCTGHKMLGPTGSGFVYGKAERWEEADPFLGGGHMINEVSYTNATWNTVPFKFEAGTPEIAGVVGLQHAINYLRSVGQQAILAHERELTEYALERLRALPGMQIYGPLDTKDRGGVISFNMQGMHSHDLASVCDTYGVCLRTGHHCAQPLVRKLGAVATARISLYLYNTKEEIDRLVEALEEAKKILT